MLLTHETSETAAVTIVCKLIEVLRRGAPAEKSAQHTGDARRTHEGYRGAGFLFLDRAPLSRVLTRAVPLPSILLFSLRCPKALVGLSTEPRRVLGVIGVGGTLDVML
jgi:hypothetical protein